MSANTNIEWTHRTWNPLKAFRLTPAIKGPGMPNPHLFPAGKRGWFCTKITRGCAGCFAEAINKRLGTGHPYVRTNLNDIEFRLVGLDEPRRWRHRDGKGMLVFVNSMTDLFHEAVPFEMIHQVFVAMMNAPRHTFQVLTKRAARMREFCEWEADRAKTEADYVSLPLPNVWLGVSAEDQECADLRIPELLRCPAAVRFVSAEPLLGPIDFINQKWHVPDGTPKRERAIDWVIAGGESGPRSRDCYTSWLYDIVKQCRQAEVPVFVKQLGAKAFRFDGTRLKLTDRKGGDWNEWDPELRVREFPERAAA